MLKAVNSSLAFMEPMERAKWLFLTILRSLLAILDVMGVLAIGFVVTSTAVFLTEGSSPDRVVTFGGFEIPAVTAQTLPWVGLAILMTFLTKALLSIRITKTTAFFIATIEAKAAKEIATRVFGYELEQVRNKAPQEMSYAIQFGSPAAFNGLLNATSTVIAEGTLLLLIFLGFLVIDLWATVAAFIYFGLIGSLIHYFVGTLMQRFGAKSAEGTIRANVAVSDLISVFRELSVLRLREKYVERIYKARLSAADSAANQHYLNGMPRYVVESALLVGISGFILAQSFSGDIVSAAGTVGVFLSGGFRMTAAMLPLQGALLSIKAIIPTAQLAHGVLGDNAHTSEQREGLESLLNQAPAGPEVVPAIRVELKDVSYSYPGSATPALDHLSLEIEPGQQAALIGSSGAGKSTIADIICGIISPTQGVVTLSPAKTNNHERVTNYSVSYVPQKPGLVSGSIAENVALGMEPEEIDANRVWEAIEKAHLGAVVRSLEGGINANLGNYQDGLSGGQIQRLGLARALYSRPSLLVMDEATSALDAESEAEISKVLDQVRGEVTVVLIAHRLNTIQHADRVFLIEDGTVSDSGTFQDLLKRNQSIERLVQLMKVDEKKS